MSKKSGNPNDSDKTSTPGVRKHRATGKYVATYTKYLGRFDTIAEASAARDKFIAKVTPEKPKAEKKEKKAKPEAKKRAKAAKANAAPKGEAVAEQAAA